MAGWQAPSRTGFHRRSRHPGSNIFMRINIIIIIIISRLKSPNHCGKYILNLAIQTGSNCYFCSPTLSRNWAGTVPKAVTPNPSRTETNACSTLCRPLMSLSTISISTTWNLSLPGMARQRLCLVTAAHNFKRSTGQFSQDWGFHHNTSSQKFLQRNGFVECAVKIIKQSRKKTDDAYCALQLYRDPSLENGYSPGELLVGGA